MIPRFNSEHDEVSSLSERVLATGQKVVKHAAHRENVAKNIATTSQAIGSHERNQLWCVPIFRASHVAHGCRTMQTDRLTEPKIGYF